MNLKKIVFGKSDISFQIANFTFYKNINSITIIL